MVLSPLPYSIGQVLARLFPHRGRHLLMLLSHAVLWRFSPVRSRARYQGQGIRNRLNRRSYIPSTQIVTTGLLYLPPRIQASDDRPVQPPLCTSQRIAHRPQQKQTDVSIPSNGPCTISSSTPDHFQTFCTLDRQTGPLRLAGSTAQLQSCCCRACLAHRGDASPDPDTHYSMAEYREERLASRSYRGSEQSTGPWQR